VGKQQIINDNNAIIIDRGKADPLKNSSVKNFLTLFLSVENNNNNNCLCASKIATGTFSTNLA
jgi:hypothetical protein